MTTKLLSPEALAAIRAKLDAVGSSYTPFDQHNYVPGYECADCAFENIAALLAHVEALQAAIDAWFLADTEGRTPQETLASAETLQAWMQRQAAANAGLRELAAQPAERCFCGDGAVGEYEGYKEDCPIHGPDCRAETKEPHQHCAGGCGKRIEGPIYPRMICGKCSFERSL